MAISLQTTDYLSSINKFATFFGLNPFYFNFLDPSCLYQIDETCLEFWTQNQFNSTNGLSIELLGQLIQYAEEQILEYYGESLGKWITNEQHLYPHIIRHGENVVPQLHNITFKTDYRLVKFGTPLITELDTVPITYIDKDNDTFTETGRITYTVENLDPSTLKFYYPGYFNVYELKDYKVISYTNNVLTVEFNKYDLISIETIVNKPFNRKKAFSMCDETIYLDEIIIATETTNTCLPDVKLYYLESNCEPNCNYLHYPACGVKMDDKFFHIRPQSYDDETGCVINKYAPICYDISHIEVNYFTQSKNIYLVEQAIWNLVAARFPLANCNCTCTEGILQPLQIDTQYKEKNSGNYIFTNTDARSPFGTKIGELRAYKLMESLS